MTVAKIVFLSSMTEILKKLVGYRSGQIPGSWCVEDG